MNKIKLQRRKAFLLSLDDAHIYHITLEDIPLSLLETEGEIPFLRWHLLLGFGPVHSCIRKQGVNVPTPESSIDPYLYGTYPWILN